jgi:nucleotide-binding universal stress UspA family protein
MYKHILVPTDGSELAEGAARGAVRLARALGARMTALHVLPVPSASALEAWEHHDPEFRPHLERAFERRGREFLDTVREMAFRAGVQCDCELSTAESPHEAIIERARKLGCDLVVMASHGRHGAAAVLPGSETAKVLALGKVPVLVDLMRVQAPKSEPPRGKHP